MVSSRLNRLLGSLPVGGVTISWQLLSREDLTPLDCEGCFNSTIATDGGAFHIVFNVEHSKLYNSNDEEIPIRLYFSKVTNGTTHQFLCNNGLDDCDSENGHLVYLSHLQFKKPLKIYDGTVIPFSGRILIADTAHDDSDGCGVENAKICLVHYSIEGVKIDLVCGDSELDGSFLLFVVLGSTIHDVEIIFFGHAFIPTASNSNDYSSFLIKENTNYTDNDFEDVSMARLSVDVVGGKCNSFMGNSKLQLKVLGCDWEGVVGTQNSTRGEYLLPAQSIQVQVIDIVHNGTEDRIDHIYDYFQGEFPVNRSIYLVDRNIPLNDTDIEDVESNPNELVRFEYEGNLIMEVIIDPAVDKLDSCSISEEEV
jgi:hypothetical protein